MGVPRVWEKIKDQIYNNFKKAVYIINYILLFIRMELKRV